jgi:Ataxin-1 and HBP1 module (AXH)
LEHPFFVYGQGWASCNPEGSQQLFGLKCQRLQVGDICISLKPREHKTHQQPKHQKMQQNEYQPRPSNSYPQHANMHQPNSFPISPSQTPQNLSKRPQTNTTNATDITPTSRLAPHLVPYSSVQSLATSTTSATAPDHRNAHMDNGVMNGGRGNGRCLSPPPPQRRRPLSHENPTVNLRGHADNSQPVSMVLNDKSQSPTTSEESVASRKRRWSAPDMVEDDDEQVQTPSNSQLART